VFWEISVLQFSFRGLAYWQFLVQVPKFNSLKSDSSQSSTLISSSCSSSDSSSFPGKCNFGVLYSYPRWEQYLRFLGPFSTRFPNLVGSLEFCFGCLTVSSHTLIILGRGGMWSDEIPHRTHRMHWTHRNSVNSLLQRRRHGATPGCACMPDQMFWQLSVHLYRPILPS